RQVGSIGRGRRRAPRRRSEDSRRAETAPPLTPEAAQGPPLSRQAQIAAAGSQVLAARQLRGTHPLVGSPASGTTTLPAREPPPPRGPVPLSLPPRGAVHQ